MDIYAIHTEALRALQDEQGDTCPAIWWDSAGVRVLPGSAKFKRENSPGGFMLESDLKLTCLAADFETLPESGDNFNYPGEGGRAYVIVSVSTAPNAGHLHIEANYANQGL